MHDDLKRRLLREVVQDNLATATCAGPLPPPPGPVRRQRRLFGPACWLMAVLLLLPFDDMATVISTVVKPHVEALHPPPASTHQPDTLPAPDAGPSAVEHWRAALAPHPALPPPAVRPSSTDGTQSPAVEEIESAEPPLTAPVPIDLAVFPLRVKRIMLDPGHGGKDAGASIPNGLTEKEVALDVALRLRRLLEQAAFEVVMTRDKDETIPLAQRTALANAKGADLFISIHVNWIDRGHARGMETYYLGPTEDPVLLQLAAQENRDSGYSLADFRRLLDGIYLSVRRDESRRLAESVQRTLVRSLHPKNPALVNRGVKTAPFAVLVGTNMPAILAEVACLSNAAEARLLATSQYRQDLAQALFQGIRAYAQTLNRSPKKGS